jgi:hypothetical protein
VTTVIHIRSLPKDYKDNPLYVYIGRAGKGNDGYFGNPHTVGWCSMCSVNHERGEACTAFEQYFNHRIQSDEAYKAAVMELKDKVLYCFCKPKACHGDVLVAYLEHT